MTANLHTNKQFENPEACVFSSSEPDARHLLAEVTILVYADKAASVFVKDCKGLHQLLLQNDILPLRSNILSELIKISTNFIL